MKKLLIISSLFTLSVIVILAVWITLNIFDTSKSDLAKNLFDNQATVPLQQNGDVYLKGFGAPEGEDPYKVGLKIYEGTFNKAINDYLEFQGNSEGLDCWFLKDNNKEETCQPLEELEITINQNKILLNRMRELSKYKYFDDDISNSGYFRGQDFILLQELFNAYLIALKQLGATERAINLWIENMNTLNNMLSGRQTLIFAAIVMIAQGMTDDVIIELTNNYDLSTKTLSRIENVLVRPTFGEDSMNLKKIYQAEYNFVFGEMDKITDEIRKEHNLEGTKLHSFYLPNHTKNLYAEYANEIINASKLPPDEFQRAIQKYSNKKTSKIGEYIGNLLKVLHNPTGRILMGGMLKGDELLLNRQKAVKKQAEIFQSVKAQTQNIE